MKRLSVRSGLLRAELLPSKGLSLEQLHVGREQVFWDAPFKPPDPESLDLCSDEIAVNGEPAPGFTYLKTFAAGIEFYGLRNWGMPREDPDTGTLHPLHGETSNMPADLLEVSCGEKELTLEAELIYRDMSGEKDRPWYLRGEPLFRIRKLYRFRGGPVPELMVSDTVGNVTGRELVPDWGYHITFRPEKGTRLLVGSARVEERSGGRVPDNFERWEPAPEGAAREETGIIHKGLMPAGEGEEGRTMVLLQHPGGGGFILKVPVTPYFQTWSSRGGAGSREFTLASGEAIMKKNWDGLGIEIGSSALDHNGNTDPSVEAEPPLGPGKSREISMEFVFPVREEIIRLAGAIEAFNGARLVQ